MNKYVIISASTRRPKENVTDKKTDRIKPTWYLNFFETGAFAN